MVDERTARNLALIAKLNAQIRDDGLQMPKKKAPDKRTIKHPVLLNETCTCTVRIMLIDGKNFRVPVLDLECFYHGPFSNRVSREKVMNFDLSRHPYAE